MPPESVRVPAPAKINLTLEILGRRPDGYHELTSILQTLSLEDTLELRAAPEPHFSCSDPALAGPDNLAWRAVCAMAERHGREPTVALRLEKRIPTSGGLGGGSSDAAAVIRGLCVLWGLDYQPEAYVDLAASLGSDVPFFLWGGAALVAGRGEIVRPLAPAAPAWVLLLPGEDVIESKTSKLFARLTPSDWTAGAATRRLLDAWPPDWRELPAESFVNGFERVAPLVFGDAERRRAAALAAGAPFVRLSGAGPTLFSLFASELRARAVAARLSEQGIAAIVCTTAPAPHLPDARLATDRPR